MPDSLDQEIGKRLQEARKIAGFRSARSFAKRFQIPESTYSQHENGKRSLSPKTLLFYAQCFKADPTWLLTGKTGTDALADNTDIQSPSADELRYKIKQVLQRFFKEYEWYDGLRYIDQITDAIIIHAKF